MAEEVDRASSDGSPVSQSEATSPSSPTRRFGTPIVLFIVFVALLALSWWLLP